MRTLDSKASWEKFLSEKECSACEGYGYFLDDNSKVVKCGACKGYGTIPTATWKLALTGLLKTGGLVLAALLILAFVAALPFMTVWAVNALFPFLAIPYTFSTWLAAGFFVLVIGCRLNIRIKLNKRGEDVRP